MIAMPATDLPGMSARALAGPLQITVAYIIVYSLMIVAVV